MHAWAGSARLAVRQLGKTPGFTLAVVLNLALGMGATTAIFSLVEGVLLRPLPFHDSERLVVVGDQLGGSQGTAITAREIKIYPAAARAFSSLGGYATASYELSSGGVPETIHAARLTASAFPTLGIEPALGRVFNAQEESAHEPLAVISYALWSERYQRDPRVLGSSIVLDRRPYTIIGVMPRSFEFPLRDGQLDQALLWVPLSLMPDEVSDQNAGRWGYNLVGRLGDGVTLSQASEDADRVARMVMQGFPVNMSAIHIKGKATSLREQVVSNVRPMLRTLLVAVGVVLLIACVNVASLLLVRAIRGRREYAVRLALGASSARILRESMAEGLLLSVAGAVAGLALAAIAIRAALHLLPESMPRVAAIRMDAGVVGFALALALLTGTLCSLAPAFAALRTDLSESLKEGGKTAGGAAHSWLRSTLVVLEIAVALVLLTVSGVFLRSFEKMRAVDPGFRADHVLVANYQLPLNQYATEASAVNFYRAVVGRLTSKPGMEAAAVTNTLPASGAYMGAAYTVEGVSAERWKLQFAMLTTTYGDYFRAMRIPLLEGRYFTVEDGANAPLVVIVNQSMARHSWPGQEAVGRRIHLGNPHKGLPWATVVGVVADTKLGARDEPNADQWYAPLEQPATLYGESDSGTFSNPASGYIVVRAALPPEQMTKTLRSTVAEIDPLLALEQMQPMSEVISKVEAPRRFNTDLITAFAAGALLLAMSGIYAVVAFSVSQRAQEIAIRMALGAQRGRIARLVLVAGAKMALLGCGLGILGSVAVSRLVSSFLFEVSARDPLVMIASALTMMGMAMLASALPAMRAASADPVDALRAI